MLSEALYNDVSSYIKKDRCFFLPNVVESVNINSLDKYNADHIEILYLANYQPAKGLLTVIDVFEHPHLAEKMNILATPTVIKEQPDPVRRIIGDLSDSDRMSNVLDL